MWNNKGGVGKSFLSFVLGTETAHRHVDQNVILVDMCPQANLSEIVLGGNGKGAETLSKVLSAKKRKTIGGHFDERIDSPQKRSMHCSPLSKIQTETLPSCLCYAKIPSRGFQPNATLLHPDGRLRAAQLYILNVADFKGVPAG